LVTTCMGCTPWSLIPPPPPEMTCARFGRCVRYVFDCWR
jgi:hypothetical protein